MINPNFRIAVICASNMNRSMEAHRILKENGYNVQSYGTGENCKLPGSAYNKPNVYEFGTKYQTIYEDLMAKDPRLYKANGVLDMVKENSNVKEFPEQWQQEIERQFDLIITYEEKVFDVVNEGFMECDSEYNIPVHVINLAIDDTRTDASRGAQLTLQFIRMICESEDWENDFDEILEEFQNKKFKKDIMHNVFFY